jgi:hypothetical protein
LVYYYFAKLIVSTLLLVALKIFDIIFEGLVQGLLATFVVQMRRNMEKGTQLTHFYHYEGLVLKD